MSDLYIASANRARQDIVSRISRLRKSLDAIRHQTCGYAEDHRKMIAVYEAMLTAFDAAHAENSA